jgi:hypothetical protein
MDSFLSRFRLFTLILLALFALGFSRSAKAQSYPPAWNSTATYAAGDVVQLNGNWYRATKAVTTPNLSPAIYFNDWELNYVRSNTTLFIGDEETFSTLLAAWDYVLEARVADGVYLHLYISTTHHIFTETFTSPLSLDHSSGANISIIGDNVNNIALTFANQNASALTLDNNHAFNTLSNLEIVGASTNNSQVQGNVINLNQNASIASINGIIGSSFTGGVVANNGSTVYCSANVQFLNVYNLFISDSNAVIHIANGFRSSANTVGDAFLADFGGQIFAEGCTIEGARVDAASSSRGGYIDIDNSSILNNANGASANLGGRMSAENATFHSTMFDLSVANGGVIDALVATYSATLTDGEYGSYIIH